MKLIKKIISTALCATMLCSMAVSAYAADANYMLSFDIWNAVSDQASMGNVSTDNNSEALYNPTENTLQIATNPVDVSGYMSGIIAAQYDTSSNGDYVDVKILSTFDVETGTKYDGTNHTISILSSFEIELPAYLTKEGVEYIMIKMSVPYTPMDVVVGTGYLDARLRIDWDTMTATSDAEITPDTTMSSGTVASVNLSSNGFIVNADTTIIPQNSSLTVVKVISGEDYELTATTLGHEDFDLYKLTITASELEVSASGALEIILPYSNSIELYRINTDGSKTVLRGTASSDGYKILSRNTGLFAVIGGEKIDTNTFTDISSHWAETYIKNAVSYGLFNGTSDTTFSPESKMTAGMVITVLHRMAGSPATENTGETWYSEAMAWGYNMEIIGGYKDFDAEANVTREELATMIFRYELLSNEADERNDLSAFSDYSEVSAWASDALSWANAMGIVNGISETSLAPQNEATRAEVATMLCRFMA